MSMQIADLKAQVEAGLTISPGTQNAKALRVLVTNPERAFKPKEIATRSDIPPANASTVCSRLVDMGVADRDNGYYYLTQDDAASVAARQALGSAHQQDMAKKTAEADESVLVEASGESKSESLSDEEVDAELAEMDDVLPDI